MVPLITPSSKKTKFTLSNICLLLRSSSSSFIAESADPKFSKGKIASRRHGTCPERRDDRETMNAVKRFGVGQTRKRRWWKRPGSDYRTRVIFPLVSRSFTNNENCQRGNARKSRRRDSFSSVSISPAFRGEKLCYNNPFDLARVVKLKILIFIYITVIIKTAESGNWSLSREGEQNFIDM